MHLDMHIQPYTGSPQNRAHDTPSLQEPNHPPSQTVRRRLALCCMLPPRPHIHSASFAGLEHCDWSKRASRTAQLLCEDAAHELIERVKSAKGRLDDRPEVVAVLG